MPTATLGPSHVLHTLIEVSNALWYGSALPQPAVKRVAVAVVDRLVAQLHPGAGDLWLCASRMSDLPRYLRHTKAWDQDPVVDIAVYQGSQDPYRTLFTAESEAYTEHDVGAAASPRTSAYLWSLFRLLQIPSPCRLYIARVRSLAHCRDLEARIAHLITSYAGNLDQGDRVFSIVLPTAGRDYPQVECHGWQKGRGQLKPLDSSTWAECAAP